MEHLGRHRSDDSVDVQGAAAGTPGKRTRVEARYGMRAGPAATSAVDRALARRGEGERHAAGAWLHDDRTAADAAASLGALAFTAGDDVFFADGAYRPDDERGAEVLAHELAHVEQGRGVDGPFPGHYTVAGRASAAERDARGEGDGTATAAPATIYCTTLDDYTDAERQRVHVSAQAGGIQPPAHGTAASQTFRPGLPVLLAPTIPATLQGLLEQAAGRYQAGHVLPPDSSIDRAVDVPAAAAAVLAPGATPASTGTVEPTAQPQGSQPQGSQPQGSQPQGSQPQGSQPQGSQPQGAASPPPITDVSLIFRFTSIEHAAPPRRRGARPPAPRPNEPPVGRQILVEYVGPDTALSARNAALPPGISAASGGTLATAGINLTVGGPWTAPQLQMLQETLSVLPPALLPHVARLRFHIFNHGGAEAAMFLPAGTSISGVRFNEDAILIQTSAFADDTTDARIGTHRPSVMTLAHELGHLLDSLEEQRTLAQASGPLAHAQTRSAMDAALAPVHTDSGRRQRTGAQHGNTFDTEYFEATRTTAGNAFRTAAVADGARLDTHLTPRTPTQQQLDRDRGYTPDVDRTGSITAYGDDAWEEYYAEAFALFVADPARLRALRPHVHAFFVQRAAHIPAPAARNTTAPGAGGGGAPLVPPGVLDHL